MAIQRWDPQGDLMQLKERVNRMFEEVLTRSVGSGDELALSSNGWKPAMDLHEQVDRYVLRADLPGVGPEDLEVQIERGTLWIRGERRMDPSVPKEAYLRVERPFGRFAVQLSLPDSVDVREIRAVHKGGVTEVILPKRRQDSSAAKIKVEVT